MRLCVIAVALLALAACEREEVSGLPDFTASGAGPIGAQCSTTQCDCTIGAPDDSVQTCQNMKANCRTIGAENIVCPVDGDTCSCTASGGDSGGGDRNPAG